MNEMFLTVGLYLMHVYTLIQINLYAMWIYCFENSILIYWIQHLKI